MVDKLLKLYPKIKYIHGKVEYDISVIINAYNFVKPISTFSGTLINLNINLKNLYIFAFKKIKIENVNYIIHKMVPSPKYYKIMDRKWKKTKEQLDLMLSENCVNNTMEIYYPKKI